MSELRRYVIGLDLETRERIRLLAQDLGVSESRLVRIAVDFYETCLDKVAEAVVEGSSDVGLEGGLLRKCRDDIEEVGVGGEGER